MYLLKKNLVNHVTMIMGSNMEAGEPLDT